MEIIRVKIGGGFKMDDLGRILAQTVLHRIEEIEVDSNIDKLIVDNIDSVSQEARLIKEKLNNIKAILKGIN